MIFDLLNNASYNYIQRKYYITKMEKSYEYWRIACQRDNRFIILFFYFQNVHTPAVPLDLQGHRIDASLCPDHIAESYEYCPHHYLRIRSDLPDFIYYGVCGRLPGSQIVDRGIPALLAVVSDSVTFSVLGILFQDTSEALTVNSAIRSQALVIYILTYCLLIWAVIQFFPQDLKFPGYFEGVIFLTCGLGVFASDILLKYVFYFERNEIVLSRISLATVNYIFLGVLLLLLMIVELLGIYYSKNNELQQRNNLYQIEEQELVNLKESSAFIRGWKHDYKNQLQVLSTMLQQKQYDESLLYVNELLSSSDMIKPVFSSGNPILDAVLSLKYYTMEHKEIRFEHSVYLPTAFPLSPLDTSTLFTNILDNAIEACQSCPAAPWIHLDIKPKGDMLLITLSNSSAANYRYNKKGNLLSTKDGKEHGYGLRQVARVTEACGGFYQVTPSADKFTITIALPVSLEVERNNL